MSPMRQVPTRPEQALELVPLFVALQLQIADDDEVVLEPGPLFGNHFGAGYALSIGAAMEAAGAVGIMRRVDLRSWAPMTTGVDLRFISPAFSTVRAHAEPVDWEASAQQLAESSRAECTFEIRATCGPKYCAYGTVRYLLLPWDTIEERTARKGIKHE